MKKRIFIILSISLLLVGVLFSQNIKNSESYKQAQQYYKMAADAQAAGEYEKSYEYAETAKDYAGQAEYEADNMLAFAQMAASKAKADISIMNARKIGADKDNASKKDFDVSVNIYQEAVAIVSASDAIEDETAKAQSIKDAAKKFEDSSASADKAYGAIVARETAATKSVIDATKSQYNSLVTSKIIVKGDANDKVVNAAISDAEKLLADNQFKASQDKAKATSVSMDNIQKQVMAERDNAGKSIAAVKTKYNAMVANGSVPKGSNEDKSISTLISDADKSLAAGLSKDALAKAAQAQTALANAEKKAVSDLASAKKALSDAKTRLGALLTKGVVTRASENDKNINTIITDGDKAVTANNATLGMQKAKDANLAMDNIEKAVSTQAKVAAEDKTTQTPAGVPEAYAQVMDQLNKIKAVVADFVSKGLIIKDSEDSKKISALLKEVDKLVVSDPGAARGKLDEAMTVVENVVNGGSGGGISGVLPKYYVVRRMARTDSLWRIAGYSFIYNNGVYWKTLYDANKDILVDRDNPNLILPGQILLIPSLNGEKREGTYMPDKQYSTYK